MNYFHIDGFHIVGCNAPIERIAEDPYLSDTKIFYEYIPEEILCREEGKKQFTEANKVDLFQYAYLLCQQGIKIEVLYCQGES